MKEDVLIRIKLWQMRINQERDIERIKKLLAEKEKKVQELLRNSEKKEGIENGI